MALTLTPEQEALVERVVREGRYKSARAALDAAVTSLANDDSLSQEEKDRRASIRSKSLFELMQESPLFGTDVEFERDRSPLRGIDL